MKNTLLGIILLSMLAATSGLQAEQKYNPQTRQWETVNPEAKLIYNPRTRQWEAPAKVQTVEVMAESESAMEEPVDEDGPEPSDREEAVTEVLPE